MKSYLSFAVLFFVLSGVANARDPGGKYANADAAIHQWFTEQHNSVGQWCCNDADGHEYDDDYSFDKDGNVHVLIDGEAVVVDAYKVLTGPNPTGHAVIWYLKGTAGPSVYCFAPGAGG
jgi:hypothetical protein